MGLDHPDPVHQLHRLNPALWFLNPDLGSGAVVSSLSIAAASPPNPPGDLAVSVTAGAGTAATPTVTGGVPLSYGPDFTVGATGRGTVTLGTASSAGLTFMP